MLPKQKGAAQGHVCARLSSQVTVLPQAHASARFSSQVIVLAQGYARAYLTHQGPVTAARCLVLRKGMRVRG